MATPQRVGLSKYQMVEPLHKSMHRKTDERPAAPEAESQVSKMKPKPFGGSLETGSDSDDGRAKKASIGSTSFEVNEKPNSDRNQAVRQGKRLLSARKPQPLRAYKPRVLNPSSQGSRKSPVNRNDDAPDPVESVSKKRKAPPDERIGSQHEKRDFMSTSQTGPRPTLKKATRRKGYGKDSQMNTEDIEDSESSSEKAKKPSKPEESPDRPNFRAPGAIHKYDGTSSPDKNFKPVKKTPLPTRESPKKGKTMLKRAKELQRSASPEMPSQRSFQLPDLPFDEADLDIDTGESAERGSTPIRKLSFSLSPINSSPISSPIRNLCPMCGEEVDGELLANFKSKHPRMTLDKEQKFCLHHKKTSARAKWKQEGYPAIEWNKLDRRIEKKSGFLRAILEGGSSYYGDIFSQKVKAGQNKTLFKSEENLTPGYYGIRGLRAMSEHIVGEFSSLLRKRAVQDRLVSARGHTAYVQSVLVPELAVQLIMDDMRVGEDKARSIMKDSVWVGELLNEEVADVVFSDDDEDELDS
ncbi:RTC4-like domain-containing protein [Echria macrotheca]|uniref:Restriction of telomere capping protein 4 n=1 Tax=Echria macrotheca TaxID=438768 RepID=A0AAJ0F4Y4_9PEZI|nr:RTC4-like domain-containing protein [Echria macrotheca]